MRTPAYPSRTPGRRLVSISHGGTPSCSTAIFFGSRSRSERAVDPPRVSRSSKRPVLGSVGKDAEVDLGHILGGVVHDDLSALQEQGPIAERRIQGRAM